MRDYTHTQVDKVVTRGIDPVGLSTITYSRGYEIYPSIIIATTDIARWTAMEVIQLLRRTHKTGRKKGEAGYSSY